MDQIDSVKDSLEKLTIMLETADDDVALEWSVDNMICPKRSLGHFKALKHLAVLQAFICNFDEQDWQSNCCMPEDLPQTLETLEIIYPTPFLDEWARYLRSQVQMKKEILPNLREITLTCSEAVGMPAQYLKDELIDIWAELAYAGIEAYVFCQNRQLRQNLGEYYAKQLLGEGDDETDGEGGSESDTDEDMPDLLDGVD